MGGSGLRLRQLDRLEKDPFFEIKTIWTKKNFYSNWKLGHRYP